jgi:SNF2-related domain
LPYPFLFLSTCAQKQIRTHVNLEYLTCKVPLVFEFVGKQETELAELLDNTSTFVPIVFLDKAGTSRLPPPEILAKFRIVITTATRLRNEQKKGSFESELCASDAHPSTFRLGERGKCDACVLLKIRWLRLIVDEGHSMGMSDMGSTIQCASWVSSERRWVMTGTPTKHGPEQLTQLRRLLTFLGHGFFAKEQWNDLLAKPWSGAHMSSFFRLRSLLGLLLKRHAKLDIPEIPLPVFSTTHVRMSPDEAVAYNKLACTGKINIAVSTMTGETPGFQVSYLHPSQAEAARKAVNNIRLVCVGCTNINLDLPGIPLASFSLLQQRNHDKEEIDSVRNHFQCIRNGEWLRCNFCSLALPLHVILPCCCRLICPDCVQGTCCPLCDQEFDRKTVEDLQKIQPGFKTEWGSDGQQLISCDVNQLARRRMHKHGDGHLCSFDRCSGDGRCVLCLSEHECDLRGEGGVNTLPQCQQCFRTAEACPSSDSKAHYLVTKFTQFLNVSDTFSRPLKVLIFSQFREALNCVGHRLLKRFGTACVAEYWRRFRKQESDKFTTSAACFCMLLGSDGSAGLDLSFVTHIFFLEPVWDKSLISQVVSRAWRLGAEGAVFVETLVAEESIEETMHNVHEGIEAGKIIYDIPDELAQTRKRQREKEPRAGTGKRTVTYDFNRDKNRFLLLSLRFAHRFVSRSAVGLVQGLQDRARTGKRVRFADCLADS